MIVLSLLNKMIKRKGLDLTMELLVNLFDKFFIRRKNLAISLGLVLPPCDFLIDQIPPFRGMRLVSQSASFLWGVDHIFVVGLFITELVILLINLIQVFDIHSMEHVRFCLVLHFFLSSTIFPTNFGIGTSILFSRILERVLILVLIGPELGLNRLLHPFCDHFFSHNLLPFRIFLLDSDLLFLKHIGEVLKYGSTFSGLLWFERFR